MDAPADFKKQLYALLGFLALTVSFTTFIQNLAHKVDEKEVKWNKQEENNAEFTSKLAQCEIRLGIIEAQLGVSSAQMRALNSKFSPLLYSE